MLWSCPLHIRSLFPVPPFPLHFMCSLLFLFNPWSSLDAASMFKCIGPSTGTRIVLQALHPWKKINSLSPAGIINSSSARDGPSWQSYCRIWDFVWPDIVQLTLQSVHSCSCLAYIKHCFNASYTTTSSFCLSAYSSLMIPEIWVAKVWYVCPTWDWKLC